METNNDLVNENKVGKRFPKSKIDDFQEFRENIYVKKWIENYSAPQQLRRLSLLKRFCDFVGKTPTEIIQEHYNDMKQKKPMDIKHIAKKQLLAFYGYLTQNVNKNFKNTLNDKISEIKLSENSAREYIFSKLASFFKRNDVPIIFQKNEIPSKQKEVNDKVWRNKDESRIKEKQKRECLIEIRDSFNNLRDKAILVSKLSSGMDDIDLFDLKIKDFKNGYYEQYNICYINGFRKKGGIYFQTFFNGEACDLIKLYLKLREKNNENLSDNSYLFVSNKIKNGKYKRIAIYAFSESLKEIRKKLGLKNITPKSVRRYFSTILKRNKIEHEIVERMMGHKFNVSMHYETLFNDIEEFAKYYSEKIEILTLLGNGNRKLTKIDKEVDKIKIENEALKDKLADLVNTVKITSRFVLGLIQSAKEATGLPFSEEDYSYTIGEVLEMEELVKKLYENKD